MLERAEHELYSGLTHAALCESLSSNDGRRHLEAIVAHHRQLEMWARHCPENFANRAALVGAEIARIESRDLDAMRLYERAIHSSRTNGFLNNEALAYECASNFYHARGFDQFADTYLRKARACYASWGADGKVRQLDHLYPGLRHEQPLPGPGSTIATPVEGLDLATMIRVSQAVSSEIVLEKLFDTVMREAMEHAGAERGLLILPRGDELLIQAESRIRGNDVIVCLRDASATSATLPESIVRYVMRTHESVILDDASSANPFSSDSYFVQYRVHSILCLPLLNQAKFSGVLYLENNLAPRVFTSDRITVLRVLVSQAAISLENTRLYRDLEHREAKIRRLVDANIIGIATWNVEGAVLASNEAFLRILQYDREDVAAGRVCWWEMIPADQRERADRALAEVIQTGTVQPFESEFFRKDGSRVPVLLGATLFQEGGNDGVAFVLDLSEQKRAEDSLRQAQAELSHVTRMMTLGELAASIAHEVNQPLSGVVSNGSACLRWLATDSPDLDEIREGIRDIVRDAKRAAEVLARIRALVTKRKAPPREELDLNETIREVLAIVGDEAKRKSVMIRTEFADELPPIFGDRVQLQQVMLNLVMNGLEAMSSVSERARDLVITTGNTDPDQVQVTVEDSGTGLDPNAIERIFTPFYTTKPAGMGMGLSISRSILQQHGGRLWAAANEGPGTSFHFTLPKCQERERHAGAAGA
jgi:PAS domain S-box-containing protein